MNELLALADLQHWKPTLTALLLPPVPLLLLVLVGARLMFRRRGLAWLLVLLACAGLWLSATRGAAAALQHLLLAPPKALSTEQVGELRRAVTAGRRVAVVVLGGGAESLAPEYGVSNLTPTSLARLRYGLWLSRQTGAPVLFSGGTAWGAPVGVAEAAAAARIAEQDFGRPLKWQEGESRDTRQNAARSVSLLAPAGVTELLIVTDGWHMRRALRAFEQEVLRQGAPMRLQPAPMGLAGAERGAAAWLPSGTGTLLMQRVLREWLGWWAGA